MRHATVAGRTMPETRYGEVAVPLTTPHHHYSPQALAGSPGGISSGSYQQQLSPVTNSIISTSSAADGSSNMSIGSSSGDLSHGAAAAGPLSPNKGKETTLEMRQLPMNLTTFAPIRNEDDGNNNTSGVQPANALARVVVQNVPVSPSRRQRDDVHNKMTMMPRKKKVDTTSPLRKASNVSVPAVQTKITLPQKTKAMKKIKATSTPKSSKTKSPEKSKKGDEELPLQGELEAASLLANMFAV
jgi:hypothetical protein